MRWQKERGGVPTPQDDGGHPEPKEAPLNMVQSGADAVAAAERIRSAPPVPTSTWGEWIDTEVGRVYVYTEPQPVCHLHRVRGCTKSRECMEVRAEWKLRETQAIQAVARAMRADLDPTPPPETAGGD